jgi:peptide/nickel transport system permease protein
VNVAARRLLAALPTLLGVLTLVFLLIHLVPGDPVDVMLGEAASAVDREALRARLGLDRPLLEQYGRFLFALAHGDLGRSLKGDAPVSDLVARRLPATLALAAAAGLLAAALALPLGVLAARHPGGALDLCRIHN